MAEGLVDIDLITSRYGRRIGSHRLDNIKTWARGLVVIDLITSRHGRRIGSRRLDNIKPWQEDW